MPDITSKNVSTLILNAFESQYGWRPDDLDLKMGDDWGSQICEQLGVALPAGEWPMDAEVFIDLLCVSDSSEAPTDVTTPAAESDQLPETCTNGGPLLAVPAEVAAEWRGTDSGDYERACKPNDHTNLDYGAIGGVSVGDHHAIALDLELLTTFLSRPNGGVILRNYEESPITREIAEKHVANATDWTNWGSPLSLTDGRLFLFDSAFPGAADPAQIEADEGVLVAELGAGTYAIDIAVADGTELIRLTRTRLTRTN